MRKIVLLTLLFTFGILVIRKLELGLYGGTGTLIKPQPAPAKNDYPPVWELVIGDMAERNRFGVEKYGTPLQPHNGRDPIIDAYQEVLDLAVYLRQEIYERRDA